MKTNTIKTAAEEPSTAVAVDVCPPCSLPCPKCGSTDINRSYRKAGDRGDCNHDMPDRLDTRKLTYPNYPIKAEYILHICQCCSFRWGTDTLTVSKQEY